MDLSRIERENAREWDEASTVSSAPPLQGLQVPSAARGMRNSGNRPLANPQRFAVNLQTPVRDYRLPNVASTAGARRPFVNSQNTPPRNGLGLLPSRSHPSPLNGYQRVYPPGPKLRRSPNKKPPSQGWAEPPPLKTNRRADAEAEKEAKNQEEQQYARRPDRDEQFPTIAYYIWPSNEPEEGPFEILGDGLEKLAAVRIEHKVFAEVDNSDRTRVKICCRAAEDSDQRIQAVLRAIRQNIRSHRVTNLIAQPTHIVIPPTAEAMKTLVKPAVVKVHGQRDYIGVELAGEKLSKEEMLKWDEERPQRLQACREKFDGAISEALNALAPRKDRMQMRVRFGHVSIQGRKFGFKNDTSDWTDFCTVMDGDRMNTKLLSKFSKANMPNMVKILHQKILERPVRFWPEPRSSDAAMQFVAPQDTDVTFKDTEVIFFSTKSGGSFRLEADIDKITESFQGEYQIGATRLFHDNKRTKRMRILTVDVEKQIDWELSVNTDVEVAQKDITSATLTMINKTVSTQTPVCCDPLGICFPGVKPPFSTAAEVEIAAYGVKTAIQYALKESGYIVEVTVYRTWAKGSAEPQLSASVSMYHPFWTDEMRPISVLESRDWNDPLKVFFDPDFVNNKENGGHGVNIFLAEVEHIQAFLAEAVKEAEHAHQQPNDMKVQEDVAFPNHSLSALCSAQPQDPHSLSEMEDDEDLYGAD